MAVAIAPTVALPIVMCFLPPRVSPERSNETYDLMLLTPILFFFGVTIAGVWFLTKKRAAFVAATVDAPVEEDLLTYISAFLHGEEAVQAQTAPIVADLLDRLSEDKLVRIPDIYWERLCTPPLDTRSGYPTEKNRTGNDQVYTAVFSAIRRLKRLKSLRAVEQWTQHRNVTRHSGPFARALFDCYQTLVDHQALLDRSDMLLRPSTMEMATAEVLLRPAVGSGLSAMETGERLLHASTTAEKERVV